MSTSLYWRQSNPKGGFRLSTSLKWALQKRFSSPVNIVVGDDLIPYFQGLMDAGDEALQKDCAAIIEAIVAYEEIVIHESC